MKKTYSTLLGLTLIFAPATAMAEEATFSAEIENAEIAILEGGNKEFSFVGGIAYGTDDWTFSLGTDSTYDLEESTWAEIQLTAFLATPVSETWEVYGGARYDPEAGPERSYAVAGIAGELPYAIETDLALLLSSEGVVTAELAIGTEIDVTNEIVLQPSIDVDYAFDEDTEFGVGEGLGTTEFGLRIAYRVHENFAPYVGVKYERVWDDSRRLLDVDENEESSAILIGFSAAY